MFTPTPEAIASFFNRHVEQLNDNKLIVDLHSLDRFNVLNWNNLVQECVEQFFRCDETNDVLLTKHQHPSFVNVNETTQNKWLDNVSILELQHLYPTEMVNLFSTGNLQCRSKHFPAVYSFCLQNKEAIEAQLSERGQKLFKLFRNLAYGMLLSPFSNTYGDNAALVVSNTANVVKKLTERFSDHVVYADIDVLYIHNHAEIEPLFQRCLDTMPYQYTLTHEYELFVQFKKHYLLMKDGVIIKNKLRRLKQKKV